MLPPIETLRHENRNLAELISSIQMAQAPPPAYAPPVPARAATSEDQFAEEDDDFDYYPSQPGPLRIKIDVSLKIEGHGNTIILPSATSPPGNPSDSGTSSSATNATQATGQHGRVKKLTVMVLKELKDAGILDPTQEVDGQTAGRPIDLSINGGILVKGSKNAICVGTPKLTKASAALAPKVEAKKEGEEGVARKRRARSEPLESSTPKRMRSF